MFLGSVAVCFAKVCMTSSKKIDLKKIQIKYEKFKFKKQLTIFIFDNSQNTYYVFFTKLLFFKLLLFVVFRTYQLILILSLPFLAIVFSILFVHLFLWPYQYASCPTVAESFLISTAPAATNPNGAVLSY